jgi:hypothetical protein
MSTTPQPPEWNSSDKPASLLAYAKWLHAEAVEVFLKDKTHGQILFLFTEDGLTSINPLPANLEPKKLLNGVEQAIREHNLYGIVTIGEAWTYFPKRPRDHTAIQLLHGEMGVADLKDEDKTEVLLVRMESRDGGHLTWLDPIVRSGEDATLGAGMVLPREKCLKPEGYFEAVD